MKQRPLIMRAEEVRASLGGKKTQFRRVVKDVYFVGGRGEEDDPSSWGYEDECGEYYTLRHDEPKRQIPCPFGLPGDLLWVRETWAPREDGIGAAFYLADYRDKAQASRLAYDGPWRSSTHMPKRLCRLWLRVAGVRVERLQDISEADAVAEGMECRSDLAWNAWPPEDPYGAAVKQGYRADFKRHWDEHAKPGEQGTGNPWVRVIEYERTEAPT